MRFTKSSKAAQGFTLIELLIVIGLLGALTALVLPSLSADREEALGNVCDYNQAGTVRVLHEFSGIYGVYPNDMHNGLNGTTTAATAMDGLPGAQEDNMVTNIAGTRHELTAEEAESLAAAGVSDVCSGVGFNETPLAAGTVVCELTDDWVDDGGAAYTFDGISLADWRASTNSGTSDGTIVVLWITPTVDWDNPGQESANKDWTAGAVKLSLALEGQCPIPAEGLDGDPEFSYYMAYFLVDADADTSGEVDAAKLIGTSCPECGVMNP